MNEAMGSHQVHVVRGRHEEGRISRKVRVRRRGVKSVTRRSRNMEKR